MPCVYTLWPSGFGFADTLIIMIILPLVSLPLRLSCMIHLYLESVRNKKVASMWVAGERGDNDQRYAAVTTCNAPLSQGTAG